MANINLLPWREAKRKQDQQQFFVSWLLAALAGGAIVFGLFTFFGTKIGVQNDRNKLIQQEMVELDKKIAEIDELKQEKQALLNRMELIQSLQGDRPIVVHTFDDLARIAPKGIALSSLSHRNSAFSVSGYAENNRQISDFMRKLDNSDWFENPNLSKVVTKSKDSNQFNLTIELEKQNTLSVAEGGNRGSR